MKLSHLGAFLVLLLSAFSLVIACGDDPMLIGPAAAEDPASRVEQDRTPSMIEVVDPAQIATFVPTDIPTDCADVIMGEIIVEVGESFAPDGIATGEITPCQAPSHRGVASEGMRLRAQLQAFDGLEEARLLRFDTAEANGGYTTVAGRWFVDADGYAVMDWFAPTTGEYALVVDTARHTGSGQYRLDVQCLENCARGMTRYPIVLMHGMGGFDDVFDLFEYYFGVVEVMEAEGFDVYVTQVDPLASSSDRAAQLVPQLEEILKDTGARHLNLIGHSQGGIDGRALIVEQNYGDVVASLTTVATPHRGTPLADIAAGIIDATDLGSDLADAVGDIYGLILGMGDQDLPESMRELSVWYITEVFNPTHPDDPRVTYYSWNGHTCGIIDRDCRDEWDDEVVTPFLAPMYRALQLLGEEVNDGLVGLESAQWGEFLGEIPADHLDEVGIPVDIDYGSFSHTEFFLAEGDRLFAAGF